MIENNNIVTVKHIGFGGFLDYPIYKDNEGNLYFDVNNGNGNLNLYTGCYKEKYEEFTGEPTREFKGGIICEKPYIFKPYVPTK